MKPAISRSVGLDRAADEQRILGPAATNTIRSAGFDPGRLTASVASTWSTSPSAHLFKRPGWGPSARIRNRPQNRRSPQAPIYRAVHRSSTTTPALADKPSAVASNAPALTSGTRGAGRLAIPPGTATNSRRLRLPGDSPGSGSGRPGGSPPATTSMRCLPPPAGHAGQKYEAVGVLIAPPLLLNRPADRRKPPYSGQTLPVADGAARAGLLNASRAPAQARAGVLSSLGRSRRIPR